jgi:heat shock protein HslJ
VVTYTRERHETLVGPWDVDQVDGGTGVLGVVPEGISATLAFNPDGTVEGFDGCNAFSGGYSTHYGLEDRTIAIGPLMGTMLACDDATSAFAQEYLTALQDATTWSVNPAGPLLHDATGNRLLEATSALAR